MLIPDAPAVGEMAESAPTIPEATYHLRVVKAEFIQTPKTKEAKGPYISVQFVVAGPDTPETAKYLGRAIFQNYTLSGDGTFRLREFLKVTGHPDDFKLADSDQLLGLECLAAVTIQKGTQGYADKNQVRKHMALVPVTA